MTTEHGLFAPTPFVAESDTSHDRATREDRSGEATARRKTIIDLLQAAGPRGMTWAEVSEATGLHHGQASGALSTLHKHHAIIMVNIKRNRCHPYIHPQYANHFAADQLMHEPSQTLAGKRNAATQDVLDATRAFIRTGLRLQDVVEAFRALDALED